MGEFRWLHLSDLHVGISDQDWLWPTLKHALYGDMQSLLATAGPWDLVIFSGDLTQRGTSDEFEKLDSILLEMWQRFKSWGFSPKLLVLPGNHDVCRAATLSPELRLLRRWWDEPEIHQEFFQSTDSTYRSAIKSLLMPYAVWSARGVDGVELIAGKQGLLPGDQSHVLQQNDLHIGIVCLNSTWLQLDGSDYDGKLHVDVKQLLAVTENDPHVWCAKNDFNLIVTHHPVSWLHEQSRAYWASDINPAGRFDLHLFGHLHEAATDTRATSGAYLSSSIQAASTFGIAYTDDGIERIHGYSIARLGLHPVPKTPS